MYHASSYRKYTSPKSLDSVAIANKENAKSPSRSDHSTTEPNDSYQTWPSNVLPQWSRIESITDAFCIMSLLNHIVPYVWQATARWSRGKSSQIEGTVWRAWVTWSKGTLTWDWSFTDLTSVQNRSKCSAVKYSQGQLLRDVRGWTRHKKKKKRQSWWWNGVPDELSRSGVVNETQHVFNAALILKRACHSVAPAHHHVSSRARRSVWRENRCTCTKWVV